MDGWTGVWRKGWTDGQSDRLIDRWIGVQEDGGTDG